MIAVGIVGVALGLAYLSTKNSRSNLSPQSSLETDDLEAINEERN